MLASITIDTIVQKERSTVSVATSSRGFAGSGSESRRRSQSGVPHSSDNMWPQECKWLRLPLTESRLVRHNSTCYHGQRLQHAEVVLLPAAPGCFGCA
eukprot:4880782-Amphidinium_carterae.1